MVTIRPAARRGQTQIDWLDSRHTFSFGDYQDPQQMGFRTLRVINDDRVAPAAGFGMHGHRDMEIVTYVLDGALEHRDSLGTGEVLRRGDVQRMSAGTGIRHSEFNPSQTEPVHFLQIWLLPKQWGLHPDYEQKNFSDADKRGQLRLIAAPDARDGALTIHQDVELFAAVLCPNERVTHELRDGRSAWVQVARGNLELNGRALAEGDGAAVVNERELELQSQDGVEFLLFDLAWTLAKVMERVGQVAPREASRIGAARVAFAPLIRDQGNTSLDTGEVERAVIRGVLLAYDTERRLQQEGLAKSFALDEWGGEAGPAYFDATRLGLQKGIAEAKAAAAKRPSQPYAVRK